ncbi:MAG: flippase [Chloroflexi bacterium]|nr:flippase [Chloroflexota bacterium]
MRSRRGDAPDAGTRRRGDAETDGTTDVPASRNPRVSASPRPRVSSIRRLARNSLLPTATSLLNKVLDMGFAVAMLRMLQAEGVGQYTVAVVLAGYFDILVTFGLPTLITREVARTPGEAARYLGSSLALRYALWALCLPLVAVLLGPGADVLGVNAQVALAVWLLVAAMLPGILAGCLSALFMAHERMDVPALVAVATTLLKVALGLGALLGGYGFVGLAAVAVLANLATAALLLGLCWVLLGWPGAQLDLTLGRRLLGPAFPLMVSSLLNSLFFRLDALLLNPLAGPLAVGYYSSAYKVIDGLLVVSSSFTLALFPVLSRLAHGPSERLRDAYWLGLKTLLLVSVPMAMGVTLLAEPLMELFAGPSYLPHAALALQVLVWFLPLSFANGLTQYVLIALDRQRVLTLSFALATAFNVAANLYLIPRYSYLGAAIATILSEVVLLGPFWLALLRHLPGIPLLRLGWRPLLASAAMVAPVLAVREVHWLLAIPVGALVYAAAVLVLRTLDQAELALLEPLVGRRVVASVRRMKQ